MFDPSVRGERLHLAASAPGPELFVHMTSADSQNKSESGPEPSATASAKLREAQALAFTLELQRFCEVQRHFIESGDGEDLLPDVCAHLALAARRRRILPEGILLAMQLGGCYRNISVNPDGPERSGRYFAALSCLLTAYFDPALLQA